MYKAEGDPLLHMLRLVTDVVRHNRKDLPAIQLSIYLAVHSKARLCTIGGLAAELELSEIAIEWLVGRLIDRGLMEQQGVFVVPVSGGRVMPDACLLYAPTLH